MGHHGLGMSITEGPTGRRLAERGIRELHGLLFLGGADKGRVAFRNRPSGADDVRTGNAI